MKLVMNRIARGEDEVIINYHAMNEQIEAIVQMVQGTEQKINAFLGEKMYLLHPETVLYLESVDGVTYAYLKDQVYKVRMSLLEAVLCYEKKGFFRCSKSMVINIYKIAHLKSEPGSRILATMENGEQVVISRKYAKALRQILKGGAGEDEE